MADRWIARSGRWVAADGQHGEGSPPRCEGAPPRWPQPEAGRSGVCLSGGGVRSAAYNLGVLQSLQEAGVLQRARYLAAVSGGSYIAAAHAMVARSDRGEAVPPITADERARLRRSLEELPSFAPGSPEEQYLRARSAYLAPGVLGKLALVYRVLVGAAVNALVIACVLVPPAVVLGLGYRWALESPPDEDRVDTVIGVGLWALLAVAVVLFLVGAAQAVFTVRDARSRAADAWSVRLLVAALGVALLVAFAWLVATTTGPPPPPVGVSAAPADASPAWGITGGASALTVLLAVLSNLGARVAEVDDALERVSAVRATWRKLAAGVRRALVLVAALVAGPLLVLGGVYAVVFWTVQADGPTLAVLAAVACSVVAVLVLRFADLTSWSMHPFYRRRLATAFALRRRVHVDVDDPRDHSAQERPYDSLVRLSDMAPDGDGPSLVVCAAANISTYGATGAGRRVTSFTFEPDVIGGPLVGYVRTSAWEDPRPASAAAGGVDDADSARRAVRPVVSDHGSRRGGAVTLLAAVAMSGAALSPSMGKMSRGHLRFLLALANVRLGVWVPNPRRDERERREQERSARRQRGPAVAEEARARRRPRPTQLWHELVGRNSLDGCYLYVTDGGHYENLGLVELLRRGCTTIYCFDASGGSPSGLSTLADAIALARSELGVEVDLDVTPLIPREGDDVPADERGLAPQCCVEGTFTYRGDPTEHRLLYARTVVTGAATWDVLSFRRRDPRFPNHSTADQLYSDERFEAYRSLGRLAGREAVALRTPPVVAGGSPGEQAPPLVALADHTAGVHAHEVAVLLVGLLRLLRLLHRRGRGRGAAPVEGASGPRP